MDRHYSFSDFLAKLVIVSCLTWAMVSKAQAQVVSKVSNGATSIDFTVNTSRGGVLYYILSTSDLGSPSATLIKQHALAGTTATNVRTGNLVFFSSDVSKPQTRLINRLAFNRTYFLYCVFESESIGLEVVERFPLFLPHRQPAMSFVSSVPGQTGALSRYLLYKPEEAYKNPTQPQPLLLFFHGDGEKGTDINMVLKNGPPRLINEGRELDFVVVSPQIYWPVYWDRPGYLEELIARIRATQNIDTTRIYITGVSGGGGGIYYYTGNYPSKVAAMMPVGAVNILTTFCGIKDIPFWGFHNQNDLIVGVGNLEAVVNGMNACNPRPLVAPLRTIYPTSGHDSWTVTYNNPAIFPWFLTKTLNDRLNVPPVVNAGLDQTVTGFALLSGSATDNQGIRRCVWEKVSGPDVTILDKTRLVTSIKDLGPGTYVFKLTATDVSGASVSDVVSIVGLAPIVNKAPTVNAGVDMQACATVSSLNLSGNATDLDGTISSVLWTKVMGPNAVLTNTNNLSLTVSNVLTGNYTFRLTATDNLGASSFDEMNLTVTSPPINQNPVVNAGLDLALLSTLTSFSIVGSAIDSDGTIATLSWTQMSGTPLVLSNTSSSSLLVSNLITGNFTFRLTAVDNLGDSSFDDVNVAITSPPPPSNQLPLVNAGQDMTNVLTINSLTISGFVSDIDGTIVGTTWTQLAGPSIVLQNTTLTNLVLTSLLTGNYTFRLSATDDRGGMAFDDVNLTLSPPLAAQPPTSILNGLSASYFKNISLLGTPALSRLDTTVNFDWSNGGPSSVVGVDQFSARWEGKIKAPATGTYTFSTTSDDGVRLWVNNVSLISNWTPHWVTTDNATINLVANEVYDIKMEYFESYGFAVSRLLWAYPGQTRQVIPKAFLFPLQNNLRKESEVVEESDLVPNWEIYPNPTSSKVEIIAPQEEKNVEISVRNTLGNEVFYQKFDAENSPLLIDVSDFNSGIYFFFISTPTTKINKRICVE